MYAWHVKLLCLMCAVLFSDCLWKSKNNSHFSHSLFLLLTFHFFHSFFLHLEFDHFVSHIVSFDAVFSITILFHVSFSFCFILFMCVYINLRINKWTITEESKWGARGGGWLWVEDVKLVLYSYLIILWMSTGFDRVDSELCQCYLYGSCDCFALNLIWTLARQIRSVPLFLVFVKSRVAAEPLCFSNVLFLFFLVNFEIWYLRKCAIQMMIYIYIRFEISGWLMHWILLGSRTHPINFEV